MATVVQRDPETSASPQHSPGNVEARTQTVLFLKKEMPRPFERNALLAGQENASNHTIRFPKTHI